jgi:hypothetical protein
VTRGDSQEELRETYRVFAALPGALPSRGGDFAAQISSLSGDQLAVEAGDVGTQKRVAHFQVVIKEDEGLCRVQA